MPNQDADDWVNIALDPTAQGKVAEIISEANAEESQPKPVIPLPPDGLVRLSGGSRVDDKPVTTALVTELTGEAEEQLSKVNGSMVRWMNVLLRCGTEEIADQTATTDSLDALLVGDRDLLILAIRAATYGPLVEVGEVECPGCGEEFEAVIDLERNVPVREMKGEPNFEVPLRKGGVARVRLPNGADQTAYNDDPDLTDAERNSLLLSRCVETLPGDLGEYMPVGGFPSLVRSLGVSDRKKILSEIDNRMPGPRYDEVEIEHAECGTKIPVPPLGLVPLFPGL